MLLLLLHIIAGSILIGSSLYLALRGVERKLTKLGMPVLCSSFGATLASGVGLIVVSSASITHFCITMSMISALSLSSVVLYRSRVGA